MTGETMESQQDDFEARVEALDPAALIHKYGIPGAVIFLVNKIAELKTKIKTPVASPPST